jgi:uncharacterized protein (DUF302 family)
MMGAPTKLGLTVDVASALAVAEARVRQALSAEGFGVVSEIDMQATLRAKLGVELPGYRILGACIPLLAHRAVTADPTVGLLLPCNVVVREVEEGTRVEFVDPVVLLQLVDNPVVGQVAAEAKEGIRRVAAALTTETSDLGDAELR